VLPAVREKKGKERSCILLCAADGQKKGETYRAGCLQDEKEAGKQGERIGASASARHRSPQKEGERRRVISGLMRSKEGRGPFLSSVKKGREKKSRRWSFYWAARR